MGASALMFGEHSRERFGAGGQRLPVRELVGQQQHSQIKPWLGPAPVILSEE